MAIPAKMNRDVVECRWRMANKPTLSFVLFVLYGEGGTATSRELGVSKVYGYLAWFLDRGAIMQWLLRSEKKSRQSNEITRDCTLNWRSDYLTDMN
jgi:hypothetical protein